MKIKVSVGERIFDVFNVCFMIFLMVIMAYPLYYVLMASFSLPSEIAVHAGPILWPRGFQTVAYKLVLEDPDIITGYINTIIYVVVGTSLNVVLTVMLGYVLSRKNLMLKKMLMMIIVFTMFFGGGMIPTYIMMTQLRIIGTRFSVLLPGMVSTTNMIIMRTAFQGIPDSLEESARIDGASDLRILIKIMIPLAIPTISVLLLFYGVGHWNSWFSAFLYLRDRTKFPLQLILREILVNSGTHDMMIPLGQFNGQDMSEIIKYATIVVSTLPVLCIYPLLQKNFVKGVMIGAIKG